MVMLAGRPVAARIGRAANQTTANDYSDTVHTCYIMLLRYGRMRKWVSGFDVNGCHLLESRTATCKMLSSFKAVMDSMLSTLPWLLLLTQTCRFSI
jgi:hypothetical protein